ncbi:MAG: glycosyl transferase group 1 [Planctomycetaceae bacterium]|nr:glycosyl transferase group 1 [Planctomycetaceae bacterium]
MPIASPEIVPIKIAFCITDLNPGGAERALVQLVTRLDRLKWEPRVYCLAGPGQLVDVLEDAGIPTICLGARRWWHAGVVWKLFWELRKFQPQLIQTFLFHANLVGRIAAWMASVPHRISGIRVAERRRKIYLWLDRWTESLVEKHVCVSQSVAEFSRGSGRLSRQKIIVIPNGVDAELFRAATPLDLCSLGLAGDFDTWLTVGRLDPQKGPYDLFESVRKLSPAHPRLRLLWAGEGPLRESLQAWIDTHQLQDVIRLIGWRDDVPRLLRSVQGFVLASRWEGMPNAVLEALAAGLPVVSTRVEGVEEIVQHETTGWLAPVCDSSEFARIWGQVLDAPALRGCVAAAGQRLVMQNFSWDEMVRRYVALYEQLLGTAAMRGGIRS